MILVVNFFSFISLLKTKLVPTWLLLLISSCGCNQAPKHLPIKGVALSSQANPRKLNSVRTNGRAISIKSNYPTFSRSGHFPLGKVLGRHWSWRELILVFILVDLGSSPSLFLAENVDNYGVIAIGQKFDRRSKRSSFAELISINVQFPKWKRLHFGR